MPALVSKCLQYNLIRNKILYNNILIVLSETSNHTFIKPFQLLSSIKYLKGHGLNIYINTVMNSYVI
jgi:hypothetical protein